MRRFATSVPFRVVMAASSPNLMFRLDLPLNPTTTTTVMSSLGSDSFRLFMANSNAVPPGVDAASQPAAAAEKKKETTKKADEKKPAPAPTPAAAPAEITPEIRAKIDLMLAVGEECQTVAELEQIIAKKPNPICYDGFEPSGRMHIAQGVFKAVNVNRCVKAGCTFVFWVADWFALMNDKMGGELERIQTVGKYFIEVWRASGMDMTGVKFLWSSEEINKHAKDYWTRVMDIGRKSSLARITKCCQIMGRKEGTLTSAQIMYPLMQCTDIFFLKADVCQLGVDQRKVNMLARDYCDQIGRKLKPIVLSHHMVQGLAEERDEETGELKKMSKSNPDSAVFMEDSAEDIRRKMLNAYCPKTVKENPCLDYTRNIVFSKLDTFLGYSSYADLEAAFVAGTLSETDLKEGLATAVDSFVAPVRNHFQTNAEAKALLEKVQEYKKQASDPKPARAAPAAPSTPHAVAWVYPSLHLPLGDILHIVRSLNQSVANGAKATLVLADWSAFACNHIVGEEKDIAAVLDYATNVLTGYGLDAKVAVVKQSDFILKNSDAYWVGVIEVGRKFMLNEVEAAWGKPIEIAGQVLTTLMHIADAAHLQATEVVGGYVGVTAGMNELIARFLPYVKCVNTNTFPLPLLCDTSAMNTAPVSNDDRFFYDEAEADAKKKIKRAFGPPNVTEGNPLMPLAALCMSAINKNTLTVSRAPDHGGNVDYTSMEQLVADYKSGALHPGDLKAAITGVLVPATKPARDAMASAAGKKLLTALKVVEKKQAKK
eukprot:PhM_4_TR12676/c0_g1_i1/m.41143/K01866/YARS, tyrS; tyrosyl-tRNA synthetase